MRKTTVFATLIGLGLLSLPLAASSVQVSASASFTGGNIGDWSFQYAAGGPDLFLQSITIDLTPTNIAFDSAAGGFGSLSNQDMCCYAGTDVTTGFTGESASGAALDGQQTLTLYFSDFLPGDSFQFTLDVDHPNPVLTPLKDCSGLSGVRLGACQLANAGITAANNAALALAQLVTTNQMANALVTFQFGGDGYVTSSFTENFGRITLQDFVNGQTGSDSTVQGDVATPEPASYVLLGAGLALCEVLRRRRR